MSNQDLKIIAASILKTEANELLQAADKVSESIVDAAKLIDNHNGKVMICGLGKSGLIAQKIAATFCSVGRKAVFLPIGWGERQPFNPWRPVNFLTDKTQRDPISEQTNLKSLLCKVTKKPSTRKSC